MSGLIFFIRVSEDWHEERYIEKGIKKKRRKLVIDNQTKKKITGNTNP
jgi:hypothetical protein